MKTTLSKKLMSKAYIERDISWMYFNHRILQEAMEPHVPLLERLNFLGIYSNNLDEFFRVRMATLGRIAESEDRKFIAEREHATQLIKQINKLNSKYSKEFEQAINSLPDL
ncbi:MAG: RNA degradosome polyphosphate kinase, partial [Prevotella sp.]|nr:RNA degradosome polyphosphate kinase [Prevotella sp.]